MIDHVEPPSGLKAGAISLTGAIMQSITTMSPAITVAFSVPFLAGTAGAASPLAVLLAAGVSFLLGYTLAQLSRHITSAGSYHTFAEVVFGKNMGFMVGWVYLLFYPVAAGMLCSLLGNMLHDVLESEYGWNLQWWIPAVLLLALITVVTYLGVGLSVKVLIYLGSFELLVMSVLAIWGLASPGSGGLSIEWISGGGSLGGQAFFLAFIFSIYSFTGWDAAAALGEETTNPRRNVPIAVMGSIAVLGAFVLLTTWGEITGWGIDRLGDLATSESLPILAVAQQYWGSWGKLLVLLAIINSVIGAALACMNAATRLLYDLGRSGALPASLRRLSRRRIPITALAVQTVINVLVLTVMVTIVGVDQIYQFTGLMFVFALTFVYLVGGAAVFKLYRTTARSEFNVLKHVVVPLVGAVALVAVAYMSLNPAPPPPLNWALPVALVWALIGLGILVVNIVVRRSQGRGDSGGVSGPELHAETAEQGETDSTDPERTENTIQT